MIVHVPAIRCAGAHHAEDTNCIGPHCGLRADFLGFGAELPQRPVNVMVPFAVGNSPEEFAAMISADIALWAEAAKRAGVQDK
jgi:hypothetical protein